MLCLLPYYVNVVEGVFGSLVLLSNFKLKFEFLTICFFKIIKKSTKLNYFAFHWHSLVTLFYVAPSSFYNSARRVISMPVQNMNCLIPTNGLFCIKRILLISDLSIKINSCFSCSKEFETQKKMKFLTRCIHTLNLLPHFN